MLLATDRDDDFAQMPLIVWSWTVPADALSEMPAKAIDPQTDCLSTDNDTSLRQQALNLCRIQGEAMVDPNRIGDDLSGRAKAF